MILPSKVVTCLIAAREKKWSCNCANPQMLQNTTNHYQVLAAAKSPKRAIYSSIMGRFGPKWARCRPADIILRPISTNRIHAMMIIALGTSVTSFRPIHKPNNTVKSVLGLPATVVRTDQFWQSWSPGGLQTWRGCHRSLKAQNRERRPFLGFLHANSYFRTQKYTLHIAEFAIYLIFLMQVSFLWHGTVHLSSNDHPKMGRLIFLLLMNIF